MQENDQQSEFRTDAILESLPDGFQAFDRNFRYVYLNKRAEQILGRSRESLIGKVYWEEYPEAAGTSIHDRYMDAMMSRLTIVFEDFNPHDNRWVQVTLQPAEVGLGVFTRDISDQKTTELALLGRERHYRAVFDNVLDAVLITDDSAHYIDANPAACKLFALPVETIRGTSVYHYTPPEQMDDAVKSWDDFMNTGEQSGEFTLMRPGGGTRVVEFRARANVLPGLHINVLRDVTDRRQAEEQRTLSDERISRLLDDLREERETLDTINRLGRVLSAELDLHKLVQAATDTATAVTGAQFGAFFYNVLNEQGEAYLLYTISGVPREEFSKFPMPRATPLFGPTFRGEGTIRIADVLEDARYGQMPPYHGMPPGHLPVRSYLALPVRSRSGEVLGGLFFGHDQPNVFTERAEQNVEALVAHISVAVDNAQLFGRAQSEIAERHKAEEMVTISQIQTRAFLRDVLASVTEGRLRLCDVPADLPPLLPDAPETIIVTRESLAAVRRATEAAARIADLTSDRCQDLVTAASEAAMNAVVHAGGGTAIVSVSQQQRIVQVRIEDTGMGIDMSRLPRATLDRGYTSGEGFGHGFWLMLNTTDRVWLLTGATGTTVVIEHGSEPQPPGWLRDRM